MPVWVQILIALVGAGGVTAIYQLLFVDPKLARQTEVTGLKGETSGLRGEVNGLWAELGKERTNHEETRNKLRGVEGSVRTLEDHLRQCEAERARLLERIHELGC